MFQRHQQLHQSRIFSRPNPLQFKILSIEDLNRDFRWPSLRGQDTMIEDHTTADLIHICEIIIIETADMTHATYVTVVTIDQIRNSNAMNARGMVHGSLTGQNHRERYYIGQMSKF
jgi:hypothetical protein